MSIQVFELAEGASRSRNSATKRYLVVGPETLEAAKVVVINLTGDPSLCPKYYDGLIRTDYNVEEIAGKPGFYIAEITYEQRDLKEAEHNPPPEFPFYKITVNFTTKGLTTRRIVGLSNNTSVTPYKQGDESKTPLYQPVNHGALVNVTEEGVEGVDVIIPTLDFTITKEFAADAVTVGFVRLLYSLTGTVNEDAFLGFAPGELLYKGVDASFNDDRWSITYDFSAIPNVSNLQITAPVFDPQRQVITGVFEIESKKGWEFLWIEFVDGAGPLKKIMKQVNVIKVYPEANFSTTLGI